MVESEVYNEYNNEDFDEVFDGLVKDLEGEVLSLHLTDFEDVNYLHGTKGMCSKNVRSVSDFSEDTSLKSLEYDGQKYIFMRSVTDDAQSSLVFISVGEDERGRKRGMVLTSFCGILKLIATFDYQSANNATAKIFKVLEQYTCEDDE